MIRGVDGRAESTSPIGFKAVCTVKVVTVPPKDSQDLKDVRVITTIPCEQLVGNVYSTASLGASRAQQFADNEAGLHNYSFQEPISRISPKYGNVSHIHHATVEAIY